MPTDPIDTSSPAILSIGVLCFVFRADLGAAAAGIDADPRAGFCEPADVAYMVAYLASDESRFVNGAELRIDNALLTTCM